MSFITSNLTNPALIPIPSHHCITLEVQMQQKLRSSPHFVICMAHSHHISTTPLFMSGSVSKYSPCKFDSLIMAQSNRKLEDHESPSKQISGKIIERRSANYEPTVIWDFKSIKSLKSEYMRETYEGQANKLEEAVKHTFNEEEMTSLAQLELIDTVERLGLGYLFENEIKRTLDNIVAMNRIKFETALEDLYATSLHFRLLRQHGYEVSQDVFIHFIKEIQTGNWKPNMGDENMVKGVLSLYEASHLALERENILDEAKTFTIKHLHEVINIKNNNYLSPELVKQVKHSLELPLHWRMQRLKARWYIDNITLAEEDTVYSDLLHLARLDFNMVQATHQNDLREMSSWWKDVRLGSELNLARDRLMEYFLWSVGMIDVPRFGNCRKGLAKAAALATMIDDVYDVYGTLDELKLFTSVIERWDINAMEPLPNYMKICFLALYNTINGIAYDILKEQHSSSIIRYLKKAWGDFCKAHLQEAKWCYNKYTPTFEEYLNNALISVGGPLILIHAYFLINQEINEDELKYLESSPDLIRWTSTIFRLCNDLGTSMDEIQIDDVPKSIQCYMNDNNVSKDIAHEHIQNMISETWKKMNKYLIPDSSPFSKLFIEIAVNLVRVTMFMYQYRNGYNLLDLETNEHILALLVDPISLQRDKISNP